jgi:hypothetical protein
LLHMWYFSDQLHFLFYLLNRGVWVCTKTNPQGNRIIPFYCKIQDQVVDDCSLYYVVWWIVKL